MTSASEANAIFTELVADADFTIPDIDLTGPEYTVPGDETGTLYAEIQKLTNSDLTTKTVGGAGTFDWLMGGTHAHLKDEYDKNRITGAEYTKAYIALTQAAMASAVQFLLQRDAATWAALQAQILAITAKVNLATAKMQFEAMKADALTKQAAYAVSKMQLSVLDAQKNLLNEQEQVQIAQTMETRKDGAPVVGVLGKQKLLIAQQITSYQRDAEIKAAKMLADSWSVQKTIDEGIVPPTVFTNTSIDTAIGQVLTNNGLD